ncbi:MBL fold metallo-hydrolase [Roseomonas sp. NAR14]|uniref:MBL fold metallo-hydrolase n=1 Tax=Roseomonas acroporae TaxID=2937791 RepID=A0A9X1Y2Y9_9PROT|nr:MBL fold metallo-hydrolase [Roseomonas acroporae]MCK8783199.1 MBL fold metallo-hydrolase [Roseomonas acroporae]
MSGIPERQVPAIHHRRVGEVAVTVVSDGVLTGSMAVLQNITQDESSAMLRAAFRPVPRQTAINTFLVRAGGRTALIDTGCGPDMQAAVGKLPENLAAAGVAPGEIDLVLLTHIHPDHSNGLADAEGRAIFPNAELALHESELAYWEDAAAKGVAYADKAREQIAPYRGRLRLFREGEVFPGLEAVPLPGHTPGHTGYRVSDGGESALIWGDIVHLPEVQVPRPEVTMQFDVDPAQAAATRRRVFDMVATDGLLVAGMHLHFPAWAHLAREGGGYRLYPEPWRQAI